MVVNTSCTESRSCKVLNMYVPLRKNTVVRGQLGRNSRSNLVLTGKWHPQQHSCPQNKGTAAVQNEGLEQIHTMKLLWNEGNSAARGTGQGLVYPAHAGHGCDRACRLSNTTVHTPFELAITTYQCCTCMCNGWWSMSPRTRI